MSDTSSNLSMEDDIKQVNFSTDYMVSMLKNSEKLVAEDKIAHYEKQQHIDKIEIMEKISENEDMDSISEYIDNNKNVTENDFNKNNNNNMLNFNTNKNNNINNNNTNINNTNINNNNNNNNTDINDNKNIEVEEEDVDDYNLLNESQKRRKRMGILRELGEIVSTRGIKLTKMYGVESNYFEMKYELEYHRGIINKSKAVSWMSGLLFTCVDGIEIFSESYGSSYGVNVKGWKEKMNSEVNDYYDVLGELYTKYNKTGKSFSPEMRLVFMILSSALAVQMEHMNPIKPRSTNINLDEMRRKAKNDRENRENNDTYVDTNNINIINNKAKKEHEFAAQEMEDYRQLKLFEEKENLKKREFERMKKEYEQHEKQEQKQQNDDNRQDEIRKQLLMMRQNVSKINNPEKTFPDYNKKSNNVDIKKKISLSDGDSDNISVNISLNSEKSDNDYKEKKIEILQKDSETSKDDSKNDSKNDSKEDSKNNSKNKSMYSKKSYKRGGGITIKTK